MKECKTGIYKVINGKLQKGDNLDGAIFFVTKDFNQVDLSKWENCNINVFNGWCDITIKIYGNYQEMKKQLKKRCK